MEEGLCICTQFVKMDNEEVLCRFWDSGMTNYGTKAAKELLIAAIDETGLSAKFIKRWIDKKKKMMNRDSVDSAHGQRALPLRKRKRSGYNLFMKDFLKKAKGVDRQQQMLTAAKQWRSMEDAERALYNSKAEEKHNVEDGSSPVDLGEVSYINYVKKVGKEVHQMCSKLDNTEWVLVFGNTKLGLSHTFASERGAELANSMEVGAKLCIADRHKGSSKRANVTHKAQNLFNKKYSIATGKKKSKLSYKAGREGKVHVKGFPSDLELKTPGSYGTKALEAILAASDTFILKGSSKRANIAHMRIQVQNLFNEKYSIATGKKKSKLSYKAVREGKVHVKGFPSDLELKTPGSYGTKALEAILAASDAISFKVVENEPAEQT